MQVCRAPNLVLPAASSEDRVRPRQRAGNTRILETVGGLDVDDQRGPVGADKQEVRHVASLVVADQKRLRRDPDNLPICVSQEQTRKL